MSGARRRARGLVIDPFNFEREVLGQDLHVLDLQTPPAQASLLVLCGGVAGILAYCADYQPLLGLGIAVLGVAAFFTTVWAMTKCTLDFASIERDLRALSSDEERLNKLACQLFKFLVHQDYLNLWPRIKLNIFQQFSRLAFRLDLDVNALGICLDRVRERWEKDYLPDHRRGMESARVPIAVERLKNALKQSWPGRAVAIRPAAIRPPPVGAFRNASGSRSGSRVGHSVGSR